jgi:hypothetical protein
MRRRHTGSAALRTIHPGGTGSVTSRSCTEDGNLPISAEQRGAVHELSSTADRHDAESVRAPERANLTQDVAAGGEQVPSEPESDHLSVFSSECPHELTPQDIASLQGTGSKSLVLSFRQLERKARLYDEQAPKYQALCVEHEVLKERSRWNPVKELIGLIIGGLLGLIPTVAPLSLWVAVVLVGVCVLLGFALWKLR